MCKQNDKTKFVPGNFDLNSIATQNTQTACTLQLLRYNLLWGWTTAGCTGQGKEKYCILDVLDKWQKKKKTLQLLHSLSKR